MILCLKAGAKVFGGRISRKDGKEFSGEQERSLESSLEPGRMLESEYHPLSVSEQRTFVCFLQVI